MQILRVHTEISGFQIISPGHLRVRHFSGLENFKGNCLTYARSAALLGDIMIFLNVLYVLDIFMWPKYNLTWFHN